MTSKTTRNEESPRTVHAIKEGWIYKKGSKPFSSFRHRYIILWSNKRIEYYTNDTLECLKGTINLKGLHRRFIQRSDKIPKKMKTTMYGFKIITNKRTWYLSVNDANLRDEWIQNMRNTIDNISISISKIEKKKPINLLLKSKINNIKSKNKDKWNQLMAQQRIKDINDHKNISNTSTKTNNRLQCEYQRKIKPHRKGKNVELITWSDRDNDSNDEQVSNDIYSSLNETENDQQEPGENINNAENVEFKEENVGEFNNNDDDENEEGSKLGLSLSSTPMLSSPNSPNTTIRDIDNSLYSEFTDFWDLEDAQKCKYIELSDNIINGIHCIKKKSTEWISCFGTKIIKNGDNKIWRIRILSRNKNKNKINKNKNNGNIVIGICDIQTIKQNKVKYGGFWMNPYFGYGYAGYSGKKLNGNDKESKEYGKQYGINDIITMKLILNDKKNELIFICNNKNNGIAFNVDNKRQYVLAVALCNDQYDIQIFD